MVIDFNKIDEVANPNFKGGEGDTMFRTFNDGTNKIMLGRLIPGASIGLHTHTENSETIFIISGKGKVLYDGGCERVSAGQCHYCPMGHEHSLINDSDEDLIFYAVVAKHK